MVMKEDLILEWRTKQYLISGYKSSELMLLVHVNGCALWLTEAVCQE